MKKPLPMVQAIAVFIIGVLLGTVFTFGMQYWNRNVSKDDCLLVHTQLIDHVTIRQARRPMKMKQIAIECSNERKYFIDGCCINDRVTDSIVRLNEQDEITLLIHPNSNTIVEFVSGGTFILSFEDSIARLSSEATGFLYLGLFMYLAALVGLYSILRNALRKWQR